MSHPSSSQSRREAQREELRKQREAELKRQRSKRTIVIALITIAALILAAGVGYGLFQAFKPKESAAVNQPSAISKSTPYLQVGADSNAPVLDLVEDFMCPYCGEFESVNHEDIINLAKNKQATVRFHIRTFLSDGASTTRYSSRAAGAAVCTYQESPDIFLAFQDLLWTNQPKEGGPGLTDKQLADYAKQAGASAATQKCITDRAYEGYADSVLEPAGAKLSASTPAVFINGKQWSESKALWREAGALSAAVIAAGPGTGVSDSGK